MATYIEWGPCRLNNLKIGTSGGGTKYTVTDGMLVYVGTDGDSNTNRVIPVTDVVASRPNGIAVQTTAQTAYSADTIDVVLFPCQILTNNVDATLPPVATADNLVYPLNAGTFSNTDTDSGLYSLGVCIEAIASGTYNGYKRLQLLGH